MGFVWLVDGAGLDEDDREKGTLGKAMEEEVEA